MIHCKSCDSNNTSYLFSNRSSLFSFSRAQSECMNHGAVLANNLDAETYKRLNNCCYDSVKNRYFWIGLSFNFDCPEFGNNVFSWITNKSSCVNFDPLQIKRREVRNCQAVRIKIENKPNKVPSADLSSCPSRLSFICQKPIKSNVGTTATARNAIKHNDFSPAIVGAVLGTMFLVLALICFLYKKDILKKFNGLTGAATSKAEKEQVDELQTNEIYFV